MSLLDSACRIGLRKYLLNELIMRPKYTRHFSDSNLVAGGRASPRIHRFPERTEIPRGLRVLECRCTTGSPDSRIARSLDVPQAEDPRNFRILGFRERLGVSRSLDSDDRDRESLGSDIQE